MIEKIRAYSFINLLRKVINVIVFTIFISPFCSVHLQWLFQEFFYSPHKIEVRFRFAADPVFNQLFI
jgi:hypothetical protein